MFERDHLFLVNIYISQSVNAGWRGGGRGGGRVKNVIIMIYLTNDLLTKDRFLIYIFIQPLLII